MDFIDVQTLSSCLEEGLGQFVKSVACEVDVISCDIQRLLQVVELLDMLKNHRGLANTFLSHDADEAVGPVDFVVELPDVCHGGQGKLESEGIDKVLHMGVFFRKYSHLH